ncbi:cytochrome c [Spirosoma aureum]|uniref:Cytochrome c n=1 Tax=Spirosoma aureum TaxID=2692134 RepID=A0A6G9AXD1_9BACT|nr:cytochrome c [Spirosoma aureum]QIP17006.1 cytochrome c [Spirosoma aureum]
MSNAWLVLPVGLFVAVLDLYPHPIAGSLFSDTSQADRSRKGVLNTDSLPTRFGYGKPASAVQITPLDIDVRPDGQGLPAGSGTATTGAVIFAAKCAACHGAGGVGGPNGSLVTTTPAPGKRTEKVIGNYWPYATTVFDYIQRAMPFSQPGSLTNEEVYSLTAYLLTANKLLDEKAVLNAQTLPKIVMPAQKLFVPDDRKAGPEIH